MPIRKTLHMLLVLFMSTGLFATAAPAKVRCEHNCWGHFTTHPDHNGSRFAVRDGSMAGYAGMKMGSCRLNRSKFPDSITPFILSKRSQLPGYDGIGPVEPAGYSNRTVPGDPAPLAAHNSPAGQPDIYLANRSLRR
ncbi:MAG: hypothetical protein Q8P24_02910 [Desulfobacterales bacterium]|nr:hypothetical protein [Desulfobacterales bacterium]